jgi:hypothetical protein
MNTASIALHDSWGIRTRRLAELGFATYEEYLKSAHWKIVSRECLTRASNQCQTCRRADITLHAHHNTYERLGAENDSDLICLCTKCHSLIHNRTWEVDWQPRRRQVAAEQSKLDRIKDDILHLLALVEDADILGIYTVLGGDYRFKHASDEFDQAMSELSAAGLVNNDDYDNICLVTPPSKPPKMRSKYYGRNTGIDESGNWLGKYLLKISIIAFIKANPGCKLNELNVQIASQFPSAIYRRRETAVLTVLNSLKRPKSPSVRTECTPGKRDYRYFYIE